jgi:hypothetical protein
VSRDDLLADLQDERSARPAAPPVPPPAPRSQGGAATPALDLSVTPLTWTLPQVGPARHGVGVTFRVGPVQVSLGVR